MRSIWWQTQPVSTCVGPTTTVPSAMRSPARTSTPAPTRHPLPITTPGWPENHIERYMESKAANAQQQRMSTTAAIEATQLQAPPSTNGDSRRGQFIWVGAIADDEANGPSLSVALHSTKFPVPMRRAETRAPTSSMLKSPITSSCVRNRGKTQQQRNQTSGRVSGVARQHSSI